MTATDRRLDYQDVAPTPLRHTSVELSRRLENRTAQVTVMGLGYAGLPMAVELAKAGYQVTGFDPDETRVRQINGGHSPVSDVQDEDIAGLVAGLKLRATHQVAVIEEADCVLICVPTPLSADRRQDVSFVEAAANSLAEYIHSGMLVVLQSTCEPGTTRRVLLPILSERGLKVGEDLFLAFSPERIDPGNRRFTIRNTPKLVGGISPKCTELACRLFAPLAEQVVTVSSPEVAEMAKLVENSFRFINISFANELAMICDHMGISVWEVIEAAATKPFAFMAHYPGPGIGGHCIPVVPFFLEAVAHQHGMRAEFIKVASKINEQMPGFVLSKLERLLSDRGKSLSEAKLLLLGLAYKANVGDCRGSPALEVLRLLLQRGASVSYHDPYVPTTPVDGREMRSLSTEEMLEEHFDGALLLAAHDAVDYESIAKRVGFLLDTRHHLRNLDGTALVQI